MPVLPNPRHERMAQNMAKGMKAIDAYEDAGYKPDRGAATRVSAKVSKRVAELQSKAAERCIVTTQSLTSELEEIRLLAIQARQFSAAKEAVVGKAKLHGLLIDRKRLEGPQGGAVRIDMRDWTGERLDSAEEALAGIAHLADDTPEDGEGGEAEAED